MNNPVVRAAAKALRGGGWRVEGDAEAVRRATRWRSAGADGGGGGRQRRVPGEQRTGTATGGGPEDLCQVLLGLNEFVYVD